MNFLSFLFKLISSVRQEKEVPISEIEEIINAYKNLFEHLKDLKNHAEEEYLSKKSSGDGLYEKEYEIYMTRFENFARLARILNLMEREYKKMRRLRAKILVYHIMDGKLVCIERHMIQSFENDLHQFRIMLSNGNMKDSFETLENIQHIFEYLKDYGNMFAYNCFIS